MSHFRIAQIRELVMNRAGATYQGGPRRPESMPEERPAARLGRRLKGMGQPALPQLREGAESIEAPAAPVFTAPGEAASVEVRGFASAGSADGAIRFKDVGQKKPAPGRKP